MGKGRRALVAGASVAGFMLWAATSPVVTNSPLCGVFK
jgi:hypothetical protein